MSKQLASLVPQKTDQHPHICPALLHEPRTISMRSTLMEKNLNSHFYLETILVEDKALLSDLKRLTGEQSIQKALMLF